MSGRDQRGNYFNLKKTFFISTAIYTFYPWRDVGTVFTCSVEYWNVISREFMFTSYTNQQRTTSSVNTKLNHFYKPHINDIKFKCDDRTLFK